VNGLCSSKIEQVRPFAICQQFENFDVEKLVNSSCQQQCQTPKIRPNTASKNLANIGDRK